MENKFKIQESQYSFPYHYLVNFDVFKSGMSMAWGIEYYGYVKKGMVRQTTYVFIVTPKLGKMVNICDERGNRTFVIYTLEDPEKYMNKLFQFTVKVDENLLSHVPALGMWAWYTVLKFEK